MINVVKVKEDVSIPACVVSKERKGEEEPAYIA